MSKLLSHASKSKPKPKPTVLRVHVVGDSMEPKRHDGDVLYCDAYPLAELPRIGRRFKGRDAVVTAGTARTLAMIVGVKAGSLVLKFRNARYPEAIHFKLESITELAIVVGRIVTEVL